MAPSLRYGAYSNDGMKSPYAYNRQQMGQTW